MKTYISRREKNNRLIVVYSGWGSDENLFIPLCKDDFDFVLFYNYSADEAFVLPEIKIYEKITIIAWSLGVWAAEYLAPRTGLKPDVTIAVNGTPVPAEKHFGMPLDEFEATLNSISSEDMDKYYMRLFGDRKTCRENISKIPTRSIKSLNDEYRWLYNRIMEQKEPGFRWDYSLIGTKDRIFPAKNLNAYWSRQSNTKRIILPLSHYLFHKWSSFSDFINFVETCRPDSSGRIKTV